jgi:hypothetical protein
MPKVKHTIHDAYEMMLPAEKKPFMVSGGGGATGWCARYELVVGLGLNRFGGGGQQDHCI